MNDKITPLQILKDKHADFVNSRNWTEFNTPKNLAMSIAIEASELMEIFQWLTVEESENIKENDEEFIHLKEEIADVMIYLMALANRLNIDLTDAIVDKLAKNEKRFKKIEG